MQNFLNNKGKVNAFKSPDRDTIVTLRKPQVYKVTVMNIQRDFFDTFVRSPCQKCLLLSAPQA